MTRIPFWIYTSDQYERNHSQLFKTMLERRNMPFSNDMLYDTVLGMMGLTATRYDATADILSPKFDKDVSVLMTMYGNIMIRDDKEQLGESKKEMDEAWNAKITEGNHSYDWSQYHPVQLSAAPMPEVENVGLSTEGN